LRYRLGCRLGSTSRNLMVHVTRLPDQDDPDLLATLVVTDRTSVTADAVRQAEAIPVRHTDRRPVKDEPMSTSALSSIEAAANAEARLQILTSGQVLEVAAAAGRAAVVEAADPYIVQELAYWTGRRGPEGTGMPADVILDHLPQTTVPARDFGRYGSLPAGVGHDRSAVYALLYGDGDEPANWLRRRRSPLGGLAHRDHPRRLARPAQRCHRADQHADHDPPPPRRPRLSLSRSAARNR
jgi:hypothetical protein